MTEKKKKPDGVHPDAKPYGDRWLLRRSSTYVREWDSTGRLIQQTDGRVETRFDIKSRLASRGEWAETADGKHIRPHGMWEYGPEEGPVRRESIYDLGVETERTWFQHGLTRSGKIAEIATSLHPYPIEVGTWTVSDGQTIELGRAFTDEELLATPAMHEARLSAEALGDLVGDTHDSAAICAWIRLAARLADIAPIERIPCRAERWLWVAHSFTYWHDGEPEELRGATLGARLNAVRWGRPWHEVLEAEGLWLLERARPHAALDFLDIAALLRGTPSPARAQCLRALGRDTEAADLEGSIPRVELAYLMTLRDHPTDRHAAYALGSVLDRKTKSTLATKSRANLLRAYGENKPPPKGDAAKLWRSIPKPLRESIGDTDALAHGFCDSTYLYANADVFLDHADDVLRIFPCATDLRLVYAADDMARVANCSAIARYRGLSFVDTYLSQGRAAHLGGSRFVANVERLGLFGTSLYDEDLASILASKNLTRLRELELGNPREDQHYTLDGLRPITSAVFAPQLERLGIARRYFDADVIPDVIARLPRLHAVDLEGCGLGQWGCEALAALPHRFTSLDLDRCGVDAAGMSALANSQVVERVTFLDLGGNPLGTDGLVALARSPHLGQLADLEIGGLDEESRPTAIFAEELARGVIPSSIRALQFSLGSLGPRGAHAIASRVWPQLRRLGLYGNMIYDDGAIALFQSPALGTIEYLDLGNNDLTDASGVALAESPHANALQHIELGGALLEKPTIAALKKRFGNRLQLEYPWARAR